MIRLSRDTYVLHPESGQVLLSLENCGAGIVAHEFMHAILHGARHGEKSINVLKIKNMEQEEILLHDMTNAVRKFYDWYWKIVKNNKFK